MLDLIQLCVLVKFIFISRQGNSSLSRDGVKRQRTSNYNRLLLPWYVGAHPTGCILFSLPIASRPLSCISIAGSGSRDSPSIYRSLYVGICAERKRRPTNETGRGTCTFLVARNPPQFVAQHSLTLAVSISAAFSNSTSSSHGTSRKALSLRLPNAPTLPECGPYVALPRPHASNRDILHYFSARSGIFV